MLLSRSHWLRLSDRLLLLALQQAMNVSGLRLLVCRVSTALITADGRVTADERLVNASLKSQWRVSDRALPRMVA